MKFESSLTFLQAGSIQLYIQRSDSKYWNILTASEFQCTQDLPFVITLKSKAQNKRRMWLYRSCFQVISVFCWFRSRHMEGWSPVHPRTAFAPTFSPSSPTPNLSSRSWEPPSAPEITRKPCCNSEPTASQQHNRHSFQPLSGMQ